MSTRCYIGIELNPGDYLVSDCHFDGYILGVGSILFNHYQSSAKILNLISKGSISSLNEDGSFDGSTLQEEISNDKFFWYAPEIYHSVYDMLINTDKEYVYIWDPEKLIWSYAYKEFVRGPKYNAMHNPGDCYRAINKLEPLTKRVLAIEHNKREERIRDMEWDRGKYYKMNLVDVPDEEED